MWFTGAWSVVVQVIETRQSGSGPQVGAGNVPGEELARQSGPRLRADGWCRARCNDESGDGFYPPRSDAGGKDAPGLWKGRNEGPSPRRREVWGQGPAARTTRGSSPFDPQHLRIGEGQFLNTAARYRDNATTRDLWSFRGASDRPVQGGPPGLVRNDGRGSCGGEVFWLLGYVP